MAEARHRLDKTPQLLAQIRAWMSAVAYGAYLAAVDPREIEALRTGRTSTLKVRAILGMSHLVASWNSQPALNAAFEQILDIGAQLHDGFWHPLRAPIAHPAEHVRSLELELRRVWGALPASVRNKHRFRNDVASTLELLQLALRDSLAVVSALEPPEDEERASKVRCPFDSATKLPFPWGELSSLR